MFFFFHLSAWYSLYVKCICYCCNVFAELQIRGSCEYGEEWQRMDEIEGYWRRRQNTWNGLCTRMAKTQFEFETYMLRWAKKNLKKWMHKTKSTSTICMLTKASATMKKKIGKILNALWFIQLSWLIFSLMTQIVFTVCSRLYVEQKFSNDTFRNASANMSFDNGESEKYDKILNWLCRVCSVWFLVL